MSYIATTLDNLIHQTAFFNLTGGNYHHDCRGLFISLSCYRKRL